MDCKHKTKHTEREQCHGMIFDNGVKIPYSHIIKTWCADCGKWLKVIDVKE